MFNKPLHAAAATLFSLACVSGMARAQVKAELPQPKIGTKAITYKSTPEGKLALNTFWPKGHKTTDNRPAIILFFGGGWVAGKPQQLAPHARYFSRQGFIGITAKYRIRNKDGRHLTPYDCVEDGKSAVRFLRKHAAALGIDPNKIIAGGISAGGHVAACTAIIKGHDAKNEDMAISSAANGLVLFNPVMDTTDKGYGSDKFTPETWTDLSPCHHVRKGLPPTFTAHGTADPTVPFENIEHFDKLMKEAGNTHLLLALEGRKHGVANVPGFKQGNEKDYNAIMGGSIAFLIKNGLGPVTAKKSEAGEKQPKK